MPSKCHFEREELATTAQALGINVPLHFGVIPYSFRYRQALPDSIGGMAPEGHEWVIQSAGRGRYIGQKETDELYVGVDKRGAHYVFPVQAKGGADRLGIAQIEQDFARCEDKFRDLIARPIAAQFIGEDVVALFAFERQDDVLKIVSERHYRLAPPERLSATDLLAYRQRLPDE